MPAVGGGYYTGGGTRRDGGGVMSGRWADIQEAALDLGISTEAVRKRAQRGKLRAERREDRLQVWLDDDRTKSEPQPQVHTTELIEALRDQVQDLQGRLDREQDANRENRRIIAGLMNRLPELEASPGEPEKPEEAPEDTAEGSTPPERPAEPESGAQRPWWRRLLGG